LEGYGSDVGEVEKDARRLGTVSRGEKIVIIAGILISIRGTTNLIKAELVE
jgi:hypothetical protein